MVITMDKILTMAGLKEGKQSDVSLSDIFSGKNGDEIFKQVMNLFKGPEKRSQSEAFFDSNEEYKKALLWEAQNKVENIQRVLQIGLRDGIMDSEHEEFALKFIRHCGWQCQIRRNPKNNNQKAYVVYADRNHMEPWMVVRCGIPKEDTNYCVIMEFRMVTTTTKPIIKMESALWYTSDINTWKMSDVVNHSEKKTIREKISEMTYSRNKNSESDIVAGNPRAIITDDMSLDELIAKETASKIDCITAVLETTIDQSTGMMSSSYEKICDELIEKFGWKCLKKTNTCQPNKRIFNIYSDVYEDWMLNKANVAKDNFKCYVVAKMETVNRDGRWIVESNTRSYFSDNPAHCN